MPWKWHPLLWTSCYFVLYSYVWRIKHKQLEFDFVTVWFCCCLKELEIMYWLCLHCERCDLSWGSQADLLPGLRFCGSFTPVKSVFLVRRAVLPFPFVPAPSQMPAQCWPEAWCKLSVSVPMRATSVQWEHQHQHEGCRRGGGPVMGVVLTHLFCDSVIFWGDCRVAGKRLLRCFCSLYW